MSPQRNINNLNWPSNLPVDMLHFDGPVKPILHLTYSARAEYENKNIHLPCDVSILLQPNLNSKVPKEFQGKIKHFPLSTNPSQSLNNLLQAISLLIKSFPSDAQKKSVLHLICLTPTKYKNAPQLINKFLQISPPLNMNDLNWPSNLLVNIIQLDGLLKSIVYLMYSVLQPNLNNIIQRIHQNMHICLFSILLDRNFCTWIRYMCVGASWLLMHMYCMYMLCTYFYYKCSCAYVLYMHAFVYIGDLAPLAVLKADEHKQPDIIYKPKTLKNKSMKKSFSELSHVTKICNKGTLYLNKSHSKSQQYHRNLVGSSVWECSSITRKSPSNFQVATSSWGIKQGKQLCHSTLYILPFYKRSPNKLKIGLPVDTGQIGTGSSSREANHIGTVPCEEKVCLTSGKCLWKIFCVYNFLYL